MLVPTYITNIQCIKRLLGITTNIIKCNVVRFSVISSLMAELIWNTYVLHLIDQLLGIQPSTNSE